MNPSAACPANIGPRQRFLRWTFAAVTTLITAALAAWLIAAEQPRWMRLVVAVPAWFAVLNLLQARNQVCVFLAARGKANFDQGEQPITDSDLDHALRRQARYIFLLSTLGALCVAAVCLFLPPWD